MLMFVWALTFSEYSLPYPDTITV